MTLTEADGLTELCVVSRYPSQEVRDQVLATGMEGGMRESYEQLAAVIAGLVG